jgi:glutamine cyclotransferase
MILASEEHNMIKIFTLLLLLSCTAKANTVALIRDSFDATIVKLDAYDREAYTQAEEHERKIVEACYQGEGREELETCIQDNLGDTAN